MAEHPLDLVAVAARRFGVSRQAIHLHLRRLLDEGLVEGAGRTRSRRYRLAVLGDCGVALDAGALDEERAWREQLAPALATVAADVVEICRFGTTEVLRNAAEHSAAGEVAVRLRRTAASIEISVADRGRGLFRHAADRDPRHAAFDLVKGGRIGEDGRPQRGFSCTARAFDSVRVWSGHHHLRRDERGAREEWRFEVLGGRVPGTTVALRIHPRSRRTLADAIARTSVERDGAVLPRAELPVHLALHPDEQPTSRAAARRLLERLESFGQVVLDFTGIQAIGPGFADELVRVFPREHPAVEIVRRGTTPALERMLRPHPSG